MVRLGVADTEPCRGPFCHIGVICIWVYLRREQGKLTCGRELAPVGGMPRYPLGLSGSVILYEDGLPALSSLPLLPSETRRGPSLGTLGTEYKGIIQA